MELKRIIEAILFAAARPITTRQLAKKLSDFPPDAVAAALRELITEYNTGDRAVDIAHVSDGYQMRTRPDYKEWVRRFVREKEVGLTRAVLETVSIIAYKQPISKQEIDRIRGVDSTRTIRYLLEKKLIELGGRLEDAAAPMVFRTTRIFLETYGLKNLADLPTLKEVKALEG